MGQTAESLKWFFGITPPRVVDDALFEDMLSILLPRFVRILLLSLPVLLILTMGMLLTVLTKTMDLKAEYRIMTESTTSATGKVLSVETRKGSKGSITYVYHFEFKPTGRENGSSSVVRGVSFSGSKVASPGQPVQIEYFPDDPRISRMQGTRLSAAPLSNILIIFFLVVIGSIFPVGLVRYKKKWLRRLLTYGVTSSGIIEKVKPGPKGSIDATVRFGVDGMERESKTNIPGNKPAKEWLLELQESGRPVMVLVDPTRPQSIFLPELLLLKESWGFKWFGG